MGVKSLFTVIALAGLCATATAARAQESQEAQGPPMEPAKPAPQHVLLAKDTGKWKTVTTSMMDPSKPPEVSEGMAECTSICGGLFLRSDYHGKNSMGEFHGSAVEGFDTKKQKYTGIWTDNFDTAFYPYEGTCDASGKCTFTMEAAGPDGKMMQYTMTSEHIDKDHRKFSMMMPGPDGKMLTLMTIDYTRM